jgi:hypothetical protein
MFHHYIYPITIIFFQMICFYLMIYIFDENNRKNRVLYLDL